VHAFHLRRHVITDDLSMARFATRLHNVGRRGASVMAYQPAAIGLERSIHAGFG
jgi:hypothetical protein